MKLVGSVSMGIILSLLVFVPVFSLVSEGSASAQDAGDPVLVGAGDIARCSATGDESTADLLDGITGTVFTTGDNAYERGSATEFNNCYAPSWGRASIIARTKPSPGNHEYHAPRYDKPDYNEDAADYFAYFGAAAGGPSRGYYAYDLGEWHMVVLNSCLEHEPAVWDDSSPPELLKQVQCVGPGSLQEQWLREDLAAPENKTACTLAYWHHPRFSSGSHGNSTSVSRLWNVLYEAGTAVVLNGHDHDYERFAPQNPSGQADPGQGIREFVVGTGGGAFTAFKNIQPNSEARIANTNGVLKMTLRPEGYEWQFVTAPSGAVADSGSGRCHGTPPASDTTAPAVQPPTQDLPTNATLGTSAVPTKVSWSASDDSGVARYDLQQSVDGGSFKAVSLSSPTATAKTLQLQPGSTYQFRIRATDGVGNTSDWAYGTDQPFLVDPHQENENSEAMVYTGTWNQQALASAYGGSVKHASTEGSTAQFTFTGRNVAWVSTKGPNMGKATVSVDGVIVSTVDLYNSASQYRKMVFSQSGLDPTVSHTIAVQALGTKKAASSGTRVDVDAFVVLR
jgi:hypothetical protein